MLRSKKKTTRYDNWGWIKQDILKAFLKISFFKKLKENIHAESTGHTCVA